MTDRFVSNFTNRLDAKGRVSIPSSFRSVLAKDGYEGLYVHQSLDLRRAQSRRCAASDEDGVHDVVEGVDEHAGRRGDAELQEQREDALLLQERGLVRRIHAPKVRNGSIKSK